MPHLLLLLAAAVTQLTPSAVKLRSTDVRVIMLTLHYHEIGTPKYFHHEDCK